ncbi:MAG: non-canonical purine NTP pyrophosphatase [Verrucomicrobia bacterium]|nr:non-canonical purine NTP pyrophosphatase [Verrucomicrobiota bacterium]
MTIFLASGNSHKVVEFQGLARVADLPVEIRSAREIGGMPSVVEDAGTFLGNARKKARALAAQLPVGGWALADDSGLCVDALGGRPGVESAYYAGPQGDSSANLAKLVAEMREVPASRRGAHFVCVLYLIGPGNTERDFEGRCGGQLLEAPRGGGGFGYDPLFVPVDHKASFAELGETVKGAISHRARAWARLAEWVRAGYGLGAPASRERA